MLDFKFLIDNVNDVRKSLNEISVYNLKTRTSMELYYNIANKVNEIINELSRFEGVISDEVIEQNKILSYLLEEGLNSEVIKKIDKMISNGTFDKIINTNIFSDLNSQIKEIEQENQYIHIDKIGLTDTKENTTATFLRARTLLEGTDKILQLGARTYYTSANPYFVNIKGVVGVKGKTKIIIDDLEYNNFKIENSNGLIVSGLTIQTVTATQRKFGAGLILTNCTNFDVSDNEVSYFSAQGILLETCKNGRVKNNYIKETTADGIHCHRGCEDIWITENVIEKVGDDGIASFTYTDDMSKFNTGKNKNIFIKNNRILSTGNTNLGYGAKGISCGGSENVIISENIISDCYNGAISVMVDSSDTYTVAGAKNVDILNNKILNTTSTTSLYPITLLSHVDGQIIEDVNIVGNTISETYKGGIYCGTDNIAKVQVKGVKINNNKIKNCISETNNSAGILIKRCSDVDINNNVLDSLVGMAINIVEDITEKVKINNNKIINCNKLKNAVPLLDLRGVELQFNNNYIEDDNINSTTHVRFNTQGFLCEDNEVKDKSIVYDYSMQPKKMTNNSSSIIISNVVPTTGYWKKGDKVYYSEAYVGTHMGWICIAAGTPGTWEKFGQVGMRSTDDPNSLTPNFIGEMIRKWDTKDVYIALGTTAKDWKIIT